MQFHDVTVASSTIKRDNSNSRNCMFKYFKYKNIINEFEILWDDARKRFMGYWNGARCPPFQPPIYDALTI